jgi:hypothetical protein
MTFSALLAVADRTALKHLGGPVRYTSSAGQAVDVTGIFDAAYVQAEAGQAGVSTTGPAVFLTLADLTSNPSADKATITVDGVTYRPREAQPDGQGGVLLLLHRV